MLTWNAHFPTILTNLYLQVVELNQECSIIQLSAARATVRSVDDVPPVQNRIFLCFQPFGQF